MSEPLLNQPLISWYAVSDSQLVDYEARASHTCRVMRFMFAPIPVPMPWWIMALYRLAKAVGMHAEISMGPSATIPCTEGIHLTAGEVYRLRAPADYNVVVIGGDEDHRYPITFKQVNP